MGHHSSSKSRHDKHGRNTDKIGFAGIFGASSGHGSRRRGHGGDGGHGGDTRHGGDTGHGERRNYGSDHGGNDGNAYDDVNRGHRGKRNRRKSFWQRLVLD